MSLGKVKSQQTPSSEKQTKTCLFESTKTPLQHVVDSKQLMPTAHRVRWTLSFCIALCLVEVFGLVVLGERGFVLDLNCDRE